MKITKFLPIVALSVALVSCGGSKEKEVEEVKPASNPLEALVQAGEALEKATNTNTDKMKERRAKGDTLAMPYADLQKYLPTLDGYTMGEPDGATVNMGVMSYSSAEARYKKEGGGKVKVTIIDYNQAYSMYTAATAMWAMGMSVDTPTEKAGSVKIGDNIAGWEVFKKKRNRAEITLGVGSRFWVQVEADNQENTDYVKEIAKKIDLDKLSAM